jgi:uncharacterized protein
MNSANPAANPAANPTNHSATIEPDTDGTSIVLIGAPGTRWTRVLLVGVVCFAVWLLLDAPSLEQSARISPIGSRRAASLTFLRPLSAISRGIGLSHVVGWADEAMGRTPGGGPRLATPVRVHPSGRHRRRPGSRKHSAPPPPPPPPPRSTSPISPPLVTIAPLPLHPTVTDPLRVLAVGDSIGIDLGQPLVNDLSATGVVTATLDGKVDTGLSRPDYFNWPDELRIDLANDRPQLVVVMMGANDPQSLVGGSSMPAYGTPLWNSSYGQRVGSFIDEASSAGAHVLWVGMPPMEGTQLNGEMTVVNGIVQSEVASRPGSATFLDSDLILGDGQGNFSAYLANSSGVEVNIRTPDGIHLSPGGGERLAQAVISSVQLTLNVTLAG